MSCIPQNEMVVLAGDMNGHVGSSNAGYDGMHGGFRYGDRNADGSRIPKFADGPNLVICNTMFMKQNEVDGARRTCRPKKNLDCGKRLSGT